MKCLFLNAATRKAGPFGVAILLLALPALAGPLDQAESLYRDGNYFQAATAFQTAATQTTGTEQAKAYYMLGNAYHKLGESANALQSYRKAQQIDPTLSFASSPQKFQAAVGRVSAAAGGAPGSPIGLTQTAAASGRDPAFQTLASSNVYVDPRIQGVDSLQLQQAAQSDGAMTLGSDSNPHTIVKVAMLAELPRAYKSRDQYASDLGNALSLDKNGLVVVVLAGHGAGVSVVDTVLSRDANQQIAKAHVGAIAANPTKGTVELTEDVGRSINNHEYRGAAMLWVVFFIVLIIVAALVIRALAGRRSTLAHAIAQIEPEKNDVLRGIEYLDNYVDVLPHGNPESDNVRQYRQAAALKLEQAEKILANATDPSDVQRADAILRQAGDDIRHARRSLDIATGGTANIPGDDALRPPPIPDSQQAVQAIPPDRRGVSFFSSQPAPLNSLVPVTINVNGQTRQVLATPAEAAQIQQGQMPQVRAFQVGGQTVPWYEYESYNPYNDYWRNQNAGWGGFGGGAVAGFVGAELLESLFRPHYGWGGGYSPYAYMPDNDYYQGYYAGRESQFGAGYQTPDLSSTAYNDQNAYGNVGGADFLQNAGPGYDTQGYGSGGADFMNSGGYGGGDRS